MMRIILLLLVFILFQRSFAQTYVVKNDSVFYYDQLIQDANAKKFNVNPKNPYFASDKKKIFYQGQHTHFDAETFEIITTKSFEGTYLKDKNDIYRLNDNILNGSFFQKINSDSPEAFRFVTGNIALDKEQIYFNFKPLYGSEASTFSSIDGQFYRDQSQVYFEDAVLPLSGKNLRTFGTFAHNKDFVGSGNRICNDFGHCFLMDVENVNYVSSSYIKDKKRVRFRSEQMRADAQSFVVADEQISYFGRDKDYDYFAGGAFPFRVAAKYLNSDSLQDFTKKITEQIIASFKEKTIYKKENDKDLKIIYNFPNSGNTIIKKGKFIYINKEIQPELDAPTFKIFNNDLAMDKNNIYLIYEYDKNVLFAKILNMPSKKFTYLDDGYFQHDGKLYYLGTKINSKLEGSLKVTDSLNHFAQDDLNVYCKDKIFKGLKAFKGAALKEVDDHFYEYNNVAFYLKTFEEKIQIFENIPGEKIKFLSELYDQRSDTYFLIDDKDIFFENKKIATLQADEKILTKAEFGKIHPLDQYQRHALITSGKRIFIYGVEIKNPKHLTIFEGNNGDYFQYENAIYYQGQRISVCNQCTVSKLLEYRTYFTINDQVYFEGKKLEGAVKSNIFYAPKNTSWLVLKDDRAFYNEHEYAVDSATFEHFDFYYSKDKNFVYYKNEKTDFDSSTFEFLSYSSGDYIADKNGIYFNRELIRGADLNSFRTFADKDDIGFDTTYFYYKGKKKLRTEIKLEY